MTVQVKPHDCEVSAVLARERRKGGRMQQRSAVVLMTDVGYYGRWVLRKGLCLVS